MAEDEDRLRRIYGHLDPSVFGGGTGFTSTTEGPRVPCVPPVCPSFQDLTIDVSDVYPDWMPWLHENRDSCRCGPVLTDGVRNHGRLVPTRDPTRLAVASTLQLIGWGWNEEYAGERMDMIARILTEDGTFTWDGMPCPLCQEIDCENPCPLRVCRPDQKWRTEW